MEGLLCVVNGKQVKSSMLAVARTLLGGSFIYWLLGPLGEKIGGMLRAKRWNWFTAWWCVNKLRLDRRRFLTKRVAPGGMVYNSVKSAVKPADMRTP
jgi:hypothetical protein